MTLTLNFCGSSMPALPRSRWCFALLLMGIAFLLGASSTLQAQSKQQVLWWRGTVREAQKIAAERNVPILIALLQDGEEASERLIDELFKDKAFVKLTKELLPIVASKMDHGSKSQTINGIKKEVCKRIGGCTCEHHQGAEVKVFRVFFVGIDAKTPQIMICKPDLTLVERIEDVAGSHSYGAAVKKARKSMGPGLSALAHKTARERLTKARNFLRMGKIREAWQEIEPLVQVGGPSPLVKRALVLQEQIDSRINEALKKARSAAEAGDYWTAMGTLDQIMGEFKGAPPAKKAKSLFDRLKKTKPGKKVAKGLKKQARLQPTMVKAKNHENHGEYEKARRLYRRVKKKGKGLPIAKVAESRLNYFQTDEAIARLLKEIDKESEAGSLLKQARAKARSGDEAGSKKLYLQIVKTYPGTRAAKMAQSKL